MQKNLCMIVYTTYRIDARVRREAETLANEENYNLTVLTPKEGDRARKYLMGNVTVREVSAQIYQGKIKARYILSYLFFTFKVFFVCTSLFLKGKIDVVHVHNMPDFLIFSALIPRLFGKKIILDIHDSMPETYGAKFEENENILYNLLCFEEIISCQFAHRVICVNHPQKARIVERGVSPEKITVSMNVPDHKRFVINRSVYDEKKDSSYFKLIYHGTLARRLGVDLTVQAVAKLKNEIPNLQFNIIGGGDDLQDLVSLTKELDIERQITFKGLVAVDDVPSVINGMDVGVIANRPNIATELMLPVKMLEYIAMGIPVIVPRLKTIQYYFTDDMVIYFEPENVQSLAEAIFRLYESETLRKSKVKMANAFLEKYGWENHQSSLLYLYEELLGN